MTATPDEKESVDFARVPKVEKPWSASCSHALHPPTIPVRPAPILSVVIPTFNESSNVAIVIERVAAALVKADWEIIFVDDDSPDSTSAVAKGLGESDGRVRCVRRIGRRGLSGACIEGILASSAPYAAVIDADLQHDETQLPKMLLLLASDEADLVVGSRYIEGYKSEGFNKQRAGASALATEVARKMLRVEIADPMSGFFMVRRDRFEQLAPKLSVHGFKILLDLVASANGSLRAVEIPYTFGERQHGESKLDSMVALDFLGLLLAKFTNDAVSLRFVLFAMVGGIGLVVHLTTLFIGLQLFKAPFAEAQAAGAVVAMTSNFVLNNFLTYRDQRLKGFALLRGLIAFYIVCSVGLLANVGVAFSVYDQEPIWWLAGMAGALMGVVWNYAMSGLFVWRKK